MTTKLKIRSYAIFQFISFLALILLMVAGVLIGYSVIIEQQGSQSSLTAGATWAKNIISTLRFEKIETIGIFASLLTYISIFTFLMSWISGWMIFRIANRNLFDSLFLLFLCLPIISNIFALFAQVATKEITFSSSKIDKKAVVIEQTRIIELEHTKQAEKFKALEKKRRAVAKAKADAEKADVKRSADIRAKIEAEELAKIEVKEVATKNTSKKVVAKKSSTKKKTVKKPIAKKTIAKKTIDKKVATKIPASKKNTVKKTGAKKTSTK